MNYALSLFLVAQVLTLSHSGYWYESLPSKIDSLLIRVAKGGYITGNLLILPVNYKNVGISQGFYVIYQTSSGPFGYFRLSQVSVIISGPLCGIITCQIYEIIEYDK